MDRIGEVGTLHSGQGNNETWVVDTMWQPVLRQFRNFPFTRGFDNHSDASMGGLE